MYLQFVLFQIPKQKYFNFTKVKTNAIGNKKIGE